MARVIIRVVNVGLTAPERKSNVFISFQSSQSTTRLVSSKAKSDNSLSHGIFDTITNNVKDDADEKSTRRLFMFLHDFMAGAKALKFGKKKYDNSKLAAVPKMCLDKFHQKQAGSETSFVVIKPIKNVTEKEKVLEKNYYFKAKNSLRPKDADSKTKIKKLLDYTLLEARLVDGLPRINVISSSESKSIPSQLDSHEDEDRSVPLSTEPTDAELSCTDLDPVTDPKIPSTNFVQQVNDETLSKISLGSGALCFPLIHKTEEPALPSKRLFQDKYSGSNNTPPRVTYRYKDQTTFVGMYSQPNENIIHFKQSSNDRKFTSNMDDLYMKVRKYFSY